MKALHEFKWAPIKEFHGEEGLAVVLSKQDLEPKPNYSVTIGTLVADDLGTYISHFIRLRCENWATPEQMVQDLAKQLAELIAPAVAVAAKGWQEAAEKLHKVRELKAAAEFAASTVTPKAAPVSSPGSERTLRRREAKHGIPKREENQHDNQRTGDQRR